MRFLKFIWSWLVNLWCKLIPSKAANSAVPMPTFPSNLLQDIVDLNSKLIQEHQEAHGHFCTNTRNAVSISDPVARERIQADLNHGVGLFCAAHTMAIFEKAIPSRFWDKIFEPDDIIRLKALRHIRRCAANGFTGDRVQVDAVEFDTVMASNHPLRGVETFDASQLRLSERIGIDSMPILQGLSNTALIKVSQAK